MEMGGDAHQIHVCDIIGSATVAKPIGVQSRPPGAVYSKQNSQHALRFPFKMGHGDAIQLSSRGASTGTSMTSTPTNSRPLSPTQLNFRSGTQSPLTSPPPGPRPSSMWPLSPVPPPPPTNQPSGISMAMPTLKEEQPLTLRDQIMAFDVKLAGCFIPADRQRLLTVIEAGFGSLEDFNGAIRRMLISVLEANGPLHMGPSPAVAQLRGFIGASHARVQPSDSGIQAARISMPQEPLAPAEPQK